MGQICLEVERRGGGRRSNTRATAKEISPGQTKNKRAKPACRVGKGSSEEVMFQL